MNEDDLVVGELAVIRIIGSLLILLFFPIYPAFGPIGVFPQFPPIICLAVFSFGPERLRFFRIGSIFNFAQVLNYIDATGRERNHVRSSLVASNLEWIGALCDQELHHFEISASRGEIKRGPSLFVTLVNI